MRKLLRIDAACKEVSPETAEEPGPDELFANECVQQSAELYTLADATEGLGQYARGAQLTDRQRAAFADVGNVGPLSDAVRGMSVDQLRERAADLARAAKAAVERARAALKRARAAARDKQVRTVVRFLRPARSVARAPRRPRRVAKPSQRARGPDDDGEADPPVAPAPPLGIRGHQ